MEKQEYRVHLIYAYVIFGIVVSSVIIIWILSCKGLISPTAFQNFSFAASVVSIVLAVVSIVYSMKSGAGVASSVGVLHDAEQSIKKQIETLDGLEGRIIKAVEEGDSGLAQQINEVKTQVNLNGLQPNKEDTGQETTDEGPINIQRNSAYGNILLYICMRSAEKEKSWPLDIIGNEVVQYFKGYLVAMTSIKSMGFNYEDNEDFSEIRSCSFTNKKLKLTAQEIKEFVSKQSDISESTKSLFKIIDEYFDK